MSKRMPVPPELEHLIEKRDQESDRRKPSGSGKAGSAERRKKNDRRRGKQRKSNS